MLIWFLFANIATQALYMRPVFARYPQELEYLINEGGANFSIGHRQRGPGNVFSQRTIAHQFTKCTVITIVHRLVTVVNSDRVLVLDGGEVREFEEPLELIENESSLFVRMVQSSAQQAPRLKKLIEDYHNLSREDGITTTAIT